MDDCIPIIDHGYNPLDWTFQRDQVNGGYTLPEPVPPAALSISVEPGLAKRVWDLEELVTDLRSVVKQLDARIKVLEARPYFTIDQKKFPWIVPPGGLPVVGLNETKISLDKP